MGQRLLRRGVRVKADGVGVQRGGQQCVADNRVPSDSRGASLASDLAGNVLAAEDPESVADGNVLEVAIELLRLAGGGAQDYSVTVGTQVVCILEILDVAIDWYEDAEIVRGNARVQLHSLVPFRGDAGPYVNSDPE